MIKDDFDFYKFLADNYGYDQYLRLDMRVKSFDKEVIDYSEKIIYERINEISKRKNDKFQEIQLLHGITIKDIPFDILEMIYQVINRSSTNDFSFLLLKYENKNDVFIFKYTVDNMVNNQICYEIINGKVWKQIGSIQSFDGFQECIIFRTNINNKNDLDVLLLRAIKQMISSVRLKECFNLNWMFSHLSLIRFLGIKDDEIMTCINRRSNMIDLREQGTFMRDVCVLRLLSANDKVEYKFLRRLENEEDK